MTMFHQKIISYRLQVHAGLILTISFVSLSACWNASTVLCLKRLWGTFSQTLYSGIFSDLTFFPPRTSPPAAKTCQAGASQSKGVRGHQLESHPRPREPAAQLATGSGMSDFLHGVTAVCVEVSASSQCAVPFSVWRGRSHLNSKEPSQCHQ